MNTTTTEGGDMNTTTVRITGLGWRPVGPKGGHWVGSWGWSWTETDELGTHELCTNVRGEGVWDSGREFKQLKGTGDYSLPVPASEEDAAAMKGRVRSIIRRRALKANR
jgi:hypothetical protein